MAGRGIEWAFTDNWTVKMEYLFLDLNDNQATCGLGGGTIFCANHTLNGVHTTKLGLNYKLY